MTSPNSAASTWCFGSRASQAPQPIAHLVIISFDVPDTTNARNTIAGAFASRFVHTESAIPTNLVVHKINVGLEETLQRSLSGIDSNWCRSEDTGDHSVAGFRHINELVAHAQ
ncbi:hypothetical protein PQX77_011925 [Marasmius sp. AFHP31]|nr:hypothetical protein PQX77_011925 [Marasmius sp. AFHP31]